MFQTISSMLTMPFCSRKIIGLQEDLIFNKPLEEGVKAAMMTTAMDVAYRNQRTYRNFTLKTCKQELMMANLVFYFQKDFFLKSSIDRLINELSTAGIITHWIDSFIDSKFLNWKKIKVGPNKLQMHHLNGIFHVGFIGLGIAIVVFVIELSMTKFKKMVERRKIYKTKIFFKKAEVKK